MATKQKYRGGSSIVLLFLMPALAASVMAGPERPRTPAPDIQFQRLESGICQFRLQDIELTNPVKNAIVFGITKIYQTYTDTFGFKFPENFKVQIVLFDDHKLFLAYQKAHVGKIFSQSGYFSPFQQETVVYKGEDLEQMLTTLFHEANHMILAQQIPWSPFWINEGLSVYFENLNVVGQRKRINLDHNRHQWIKHWLKNGFPISLGDYLALSQEEGIELREKDPNSAYTIGYSLVYFLMSSSKTENIIKQLLWEFKLREYRANSIATIEAHFPKGFGNFERMWKRWIPNAKKSRPLKALRKETPAEKSETPK